VEDAAKVVPRDKWSTQGKRFEFQARKGRKEIERYENCPGEKVIRCHMDKPGRLRGIGRYRGGVIDESEMRTWLIDLQAEVRGNI